MSTSSAHPMRIRSGRALCVLCNTTGQYDTGYFCNAFRDLQHFNFNFMIIYSNGQKMSEWDIHKSEELTAS